MKLESSLAGRALALLAFLSLGSCASIVSDKVYPVTIDSNPTGASFSVRDEDGTTVATGTCPTTVQLRAGESYFDGRTYSVEASLPGRGSGVAELDSRLDPWYWGNIIFGGLIGMLIVDPITGAMWKLPKHVTVALNADGP